MKRCTHRRFLLLRLDTPSSPHFPLICILYIMELPPTRRRRLFSAVLLILLPRDLPYSCLIGQGSPIPIPALLTVKLNPRSDSNAIFDFGDLSPIEFTPTVRSLQLSLSTHTETIIIPFDSFVTSLAIVIWTLFFFPPLFSGIFVYGTPVFLFVYGDDFSPPFPKSLFLFISFAHLGRLILSLPSSLMVPPTGLNVLYEIRKTVSTLSLYTASFCHPFFFLGLFKTFLLVFWSFD